MKKAFEKYISDSYENGEFAAPDVGVVGEIDANDIGNKQTDNYAVVRNKIGDTAVVEIISQDSVVTNFGDGEIIHTQLADKSGFVIDENKPDVQTGWDSDGAFTTIPINDTPIPLGNIGMETQQVIKEWRKDNPDQ